MVRLTVGETRQQLPAFTRRQWGVAGVGALTTALLIGLPTDVIPNPYYRRMTPIPWWDYPVWAATAVLTGLVLATYVRRVTVDASAGVTMGGASPVRGCTSQPRRAEPPQ